MTVQPPGLDRIYQGKALDVLRSWPRCFVQTVVTSPPYWGLRDYGVPGQMGLEKTPYAYIRKMVHLFREIKRVLRPDGTLWLNLGDTYNSGPSGARDDERWPKQSRNDHKPASRGGRAPSSKHAQGASVAFEGPNRFSCEGIKPKDLVGIPWMMALALRADGWYLRRDIIWHKPNPMPESVVDRPTTAHEYIFLLSKNRHYFYDADAIKDRCSDSFLNDSRHQKGSTENHIKDGYGENGAQDPKGPHRMFGRGARSEAASLFPGRETRDDNRRRVAVPTGWDTGEGAHTKMEGNYATKKRTVREGVDTKGGGQGEGAMTYPTDQRNKRSVWTVPTQPFTEAHFSTFPEDLISPCILAGAPSGGVVLDPFMGAGTTALVAAKLNRRFLGIELNAKYVEIAERRIVLEKAQTKLF